MDWRRAGLVGAFVALCGCSAPSGDVPDGGDRRDAGPADGAVALDARLDAAGADALDASASMQDAPPSLDARPPRDAPPRPDAPIPGSVTLEEYLALAPRVVCESLSRCLGPAFAATALVEGAASCEETQSVSLSDLAGYRALVAAGRIEIDGAAAAECLAGMAEDDCAQAELIGPTAACGRIFRGLVADGAPCTTEIECGAASYCADGAAPSCTDAGVCTLRHAIGEACASTGECVHGAFCDGTACRPIPATTAGAEGAACGGTAGCVPFLRCHAGVCTDPRAIGWSALGERCDAALGCDVGLFCDGATGLCAERLPIGAACVFGPMSDCLLDAYCDVSGGPGTCRARLAVGAACRGYDCVLGARCSLTTRTCVAAHHLGSACGSEDECFSRTCEAGVCVEGWTCT